MPNLKAMGGVNTQFVATSVLPSFVFPFYPLFFVCLCFPRTVSKCVLGVSIMKNNV